MVEWAMAEVLQHAEVMRKVQEELTEIVGLNSTVEEVHLPKLKYLSAVVKETLRLHPPLALLVPHSPSEPSTIGEYSIPKGVRVFLHVYSIQRGPHFWEDLLLFKPERFLSESAAEKMDYLGNYFQYLPFGSGRRMCAGVSLAERTAMLVLASLLHAFQWKLPNGSVDVDTSERFGIVVKKAKPLLVVPTPRLSSLEL
ncbi:berbamunine synthase-like [Chenopodium quinoa]|uniref:berbamunine synthase-like n=1 Tax=Chenopodium quinoa TaxID=63459 RepID=UPI000B77FD6F|nr:berbamunine synthase-like [Chenopodium quinoa]